jgi:hypothetical protein
VALALDLRELIDAWPDSSVDLDSDLANLMTEIRSTVPSFVGLSWHAVVGRESYSITLIAEGADPTDVRASLAIPLAAHVPHPGPNELILYAATPGSFDGLALDLGFTTVAGAARVALDQHLEIHDTGDAFATGAVVGQATGVLLARGYSYRAADDQLNQIMSEFGCTRRAAAERVLETSGPPAAPAA